VKKGRAKRTNFSIPGHSAVDHTQRTRVPSRGGELDDGLVGIEGCSQSLLHGDGNGNRLVGHLELLQTHVDLDGLGEGQDTLRTDVVGLKVKDFQGFVCLEGNRNRQGAVIVDLSIGQQQLLQVGVVWKGREVKKRRGKRRGKRRRRKKEESNGRSKTKKKKRFSRKEEGYQQELVQSELHARASMQSDR